MSYPRISKIFLLCFSWHFFVDFTLREKCPNTEFFLVRIFLYSDRILKNTDQNNSVFEHFLRSVLRKEPNAKFYGVFDHFLRTHEVKMV